MTIENLKKRVVGDANDFYFVYHGKNCGVEQEVHNSIPTYEIWCGEDTKEHTNFDDLVRDKFFDDCSIIELLETNEIEIDFA